MGARIMARKGVFSETLRKAAESTPQESSTSAEDGNTPSAKRTSPNVKYFAKSFAEQMRETVREVPAEDISLSAFADRFDVTDRLESLVASIRERGQTVPILARTLEDGTLEAVYGRRRIMACRELGIPVRAMVTVMSNEDSIIAQGLENVERLETSFIERASFVRDLLDGGYNQRLVEEALGIDRTLVSRMVNVMREIPDELIRAIGPAHGVGRRQWEQLRAIVTSLPPSKVEQVIHSIDITLESPKRLKALLGKLTGGQKTEVVNSAGAALIEDQLFAKRSKGSLRLRIQDPENEQFLGYLEDQLPEIFKKWQKTQKTDVQ